MMVGNFSMTNILRDHVIRSSGVAPRVPTLRVSTLGYHKVAPLGLGPIELMFSPYICSCVELFYSELADENL